MKPKLKSVKDQVIVITGASSGIGLTTAEMAAARGAAVVLAARSEAPLRDAVARIHARGGRGVAVIADVSDESDVERIASVAIREFGRIDTWVNNAGVGLYGRLLDQPIDDERRLFDVDFWGVVHGCKAAIARMRRDGGVIVNVGSQVSDRAVPLLGMYSAAKHAVRGYTEALRMELEHDRVPIWVTLVKPGAIDTPFSTHAANTMLREPQNVRPSYPPEEVARAILRCAERPIREVTVGGVPRLQTAVATVAPRLMDLVMERRVWNMMQSDRLARSGDSLTRPSGEMYGRRRGAQPGFRSSVYTRAVLSDVGRAAPLIVLGAVVVAAVAARR